MTVIAAELIMELIHLAVYVNYHTNVIVLTYASLVFISSVSQLL